jgi:subtilase family serine protease
MSRFSFAFPAVAAGLALTFAVAGPAEAGGARLAEPAGFVSLGAIPPGAEKYFTVDLQPGTSALDAETVARYFRGFGLDAELTPEHDLIFVHGTYGEAAAAAHTSFARVRVREATFTHVTGGENYPAAVARFILATTLEEGPSAVAASKVTTAPASGFSPADIASYYNIEPLYKGGLSGAGQKVAILACAAVVPADISAFEKKFGLATNLPTIVKVDGGTTATDLEPTGDVERVIGTAPKAEVYLYVAPAACSFGNLADGFARIAADTVTKHFAAVSTSYGATEDDYAYYGGTSQLNADHADLTLLLARSAPVFTVSGDWGASFGSSDQALYDGEITVWYPASDPTVIAVGGTEADAVSATDPKRFFETAWGDGGGGVSSLFKIPTWQAAVPGIASKTYRNVPDVALASSAGEGYAAIWTQTGSKQYEYYFYGTSFAGPTWAGLIALVEQARVASKKKLLPNLVKTLYALRATPGVFGDILQGCNGYYCAKAGYDNVTGLGVFDGANLEKALLALP